MKKMFVVLALLSLTLAAGAVPALKGIWQMITLSDGTRVRAELCGDEFMAYWRTEDGTNYSLDEASGLYRVADMDKMLQKAAEMRSAWQKPVTKRMKSGARVSMGTPVTEFKGLKKGLVILVQFSDLSFAEGHDLDLYKQIVNGENYTSDVGFVGSVRDYFKAQSYGQFEIDFDVAGPVTMPRGYAYYGQDTSGLTVNPEGMAEMIETACEGVDDEINFADYDWSGDGEADLVFFVFAGEGQASGGSSDTIWPHMSTYSSMSGGKTLTLDGVTIDTYACSCEVGKYNGIDGIGTMCHEFSHCFGLPDVYDLNSSNYAMGNWDVLCYGNYNGNKYGDGLIPAGYTSYERWFAGWLEPVELTEDCTVENMKPLVDEGEAYVIYNDKYRNEYYLLENRQKTGWDAGLAGKGMLILHLDYSRSAWEGNDVNTTTERYTVFAANNRRSTDYEAGHPYPYGNKNALTNSTTPAAKLNNANTDGTYYMNKPLTDITKNDDGTITFTFANENEYEKDPAAPDTYVFYESFDKCSGTGGNDGVFDETPEGESLSGYTDNETWSSPAIAIAADRCAFFGSSLAAGQAVSPEITTTEDSRLVFKAAPYTGDSGRLYVTVSGGDAELCQTSFDMTEGQWTDFTTLITGSGTFRLQFAKDSGRFFLDEVYVTYDGVTGITNVQTGIRDADTRVYSLDGRCLGNGFEALGGLKGIYISGGKKYVR